MAHTTTLLSRQGFALRYASDALRADEGIVLAAMAHDTRHLKWATKELLFYLAPPTSHAAHDRRIVLAVLQRHPYFLANASAELRADREVVLAATYVDPRCGIHIFERSERPEPLVV